MSNYLLGEEMLHFGLESAGGVFNFPGTVVQTGDIADRSDRIWVLFLTIVSPTTFSDNKGKRFLLRTNLVPQLKVEIWSTRQRRIKGACKRVGYHFYIKFFLLTY